MVSQILRISSPIKIATPDLAKDSFLHIVNNDGHLDKATFTKTLKRAGGQTIESNELRIPEDQIAEMQEFYEMATHELEERYDTGPAPSCEAT